MLPCTPACWDQQNDHQCLLTHPSAGAPAVLRFSVKYNHLSANMNLTRKINGYAAMREIRGRLATDHSANQSRRKARAESSWKSAKEAEGAASKQEIPAGRSCLPLASFFVREKTSPPVQLNLAKQPTGQSLRFCCTD